MRIIFILLALVFAYPAEAGPRLSPETRVLVKQINAKLARWVRPTGRCVGQEILATYYNTGRRTANGEAFNPHGFTAASRHLPFGTVLTLSNPLNGRSVQVRINDRGPFTIADIDLAQGAHFALGLRSSAYICVGATTWTANSTLSPTKSVASPRSTSQRASSVRSASRSAKASIPTSADQFIALSATRDSTGG